MSLTNILEIIANNLGITTEEVKTIIRDALMSNDPESTLIDSLGFENFDYISQIIQNKEEILHSEIINNEYHYVEHILPVVKGISVNPADLISTKILGENSKYFDYEKFNIVQSKVFESTYNSNSNMLISAPTGAGKTDIALLAVLKALQRRKNGEGQIIYIVPMKALATEIALKYKNKLKNHKVIEYTGDTEIESRTASLADVIVCTPEKFDVSSRRLCPLFKSMSLVVIDEIHLLGEDRGPVLESLVSRIFMMSESWQRSIRIIGLSATLPNYEDVAEFIRAESIFYFDNSYRPVPLKITVTGFKKTANFDQKNSYLFDKVKHFLNIKKQMLIFVHSRSKTLSVARSILQEITEHKYAKDFSEEEANIKRKSTGFKGNEDILVMNRIGVHHAGMPRENRIKMENLFRNGEIDILVCTSTLAWGVNLPAHAAIIFGTTYYNPLNGKFEDIGILDVIQIFGRAGRPQYDTVGSAILITNSNSIQKYLQQLKGAKDIESRMLYHVTDALCSEIYLGTITSMGTALKWIKTTFLYIRMHKNPSLYCLNWNDLVFDEQALSEYIYLALKRLHDCALLKIINFQKDYNHWILEATEFGRIASFFYLSHETIHLWLTSIESITNEFSIIELLVKSKEFDQITLRNDELPFLTSLHTQFLLECTIDFDFDGSDRNKIILLIIAHLKYIKMSIFSLQCDTTFIIDNLERMLEALREILLYLKKYDSFKTLYLLTKKILLQKKYKFQEKISIKGTKLGDYAHLHLTSDERCTLFVYDNENIIYASRLFKRFYKFIPTKSNKLTFEIFSDSSLSYHKEEYVLENDYSISGLCRFGLHSCDSKYTLGMLKQECIHFYNYNRENRIQEINRIKSNLELSQIVECINDLNIKENSESSYITVYSNDNEKIGKKYDQEKVHFKKMIKNINEETYSNILDLKFHLKIEFCLIETDNFKENLMKINNLIYKNNLLTDMLIVCPNKEDVNETVSYLNTKLALENNFEYFSKFVKGTTKRRLVVSFDDALKHLSHSKNIILKLCSDGNDYYSFYDLFTIIDNSNAKIYETNEFIAYTKSVIKLF